MAFSNGIYQCLTSRNSRSQMFFKIGVDKNFVISQENTFVGVSF